MSIQLLSEFDFCVLRFMIAKLLKISHRRVKGIDIQDDGKVIARTSLGFVSVSFNSIKEIKDDFKLFYPDVEVPQKFTSTDGFHRTITNEVKTVA